PQLVVCELGQHELVFDHRAPKPRANIAILARMADLAEHTRVEEQSHRLSTIGPVELRSAAGSMSPTSQSGSSETSSAAQRSSIAAMRPARSCRRAASASLVCRGETITNSLPDPT